MALTDQTSTPPAGTATWTPRFADHWDRVLQYIDDSWPHCIVHNDVAPHPYVVFQPHNPHWATIAYWNNFPTVAGLCHEPRWRSLARSIVDNLLWFVRRYGYMPNAPHPWTWGLNRSQLPNLAHAVDAVYNTMQLKDKDWLAQAYATLKLEYTFWTDPEASVEDHSTPIDGLIRASNHATDAERLQLLEEVVRHGRVDLDPARLEAMSPDERLRLADHLLTIAEVWDFTYRFEDDIKAFIPVDLNALLCMYERFFERWVSELGLTGEPDWGALAQRRADLINAHLWNEQRGLYMDWNYREGRFGRYATAATFYPLWAGVAPPDRARQVRDNLPRFELDWGVSVMEPSEPANRYQFGYPAMWGAIMYVVYHGLDRAGFADDAQRIAGKWLDVVTRNYLDPAPKYVPRRDGETLQRRGGIFEKYNALTGEICDAEYPAREWHEWSAGVFVDAHRFRHT